MFFEVPSVQIYKLDLLLVLQKSVFPIILDKYRGRWAVFVAQIFPTGTCTIPM